MTCAYVTMIVVGMLEMLALGFLFGFLYCIKLDFDE